MSDGKPPRAVTRNDVARLAGVSSAVVSYVVNGGPRPVAEATKAKVLDAIEKLGYRPNAAARSLITGRSDLIGLVVPDVRNPYFAALARAVETQARAHGVNLVLAQGRTGGMAPLVESLSGHLVAGIIVSTVPEPEAVAVVVRNRIPLVRLSIAVPETGGAAVWPDYYNGARAAVEHLVEVHGHREVALVIGSDHPERTDEAMDERERGWRDALDHAGLPTRHVVRAFWSADGGLDAAARLVAGHPEATAVFASSDQQAIGLLSGLHRAGRSVPDDLAVASFDGSPEAAFTVPSLTTSSVPVADMAAEAVAVLLGEERAVRVHPTTLVPRESCGCTPATGN
ncbi:MAG: LacI family DNA-binding transcriptional regulator [Propionicimonas sp.]|uniref:LacI family DNA-binding transcriptional regulator n=1 Tax=Propionicimonas sp. TaxID=1955623 RepID=UPI003D116008